MAELTKLHAVPPSFGGNYMFYQSHEVLDVGEQTVMFYCARGTGTPGPEHLGLPARAWMQ